MIFFEVTGWSDQTETDGSYWSSKGILAALTEAASWDTIMIVFKREYGVYLDPCTAYQCYHESSLLALRGLDSQLLKAPVTGGFVIPEEEKLASRSCEL